MTIYIILLVTSLFFSFFEISSRTKSIGMLIIQKMYIVILWGLFVFNRGNADYETYNIIFEVADKEINIEKGYLLLNIFIKNLGGNFNWILFLVGSYFIYIIFVIYKIKYPISLFCIYLSYNFLYDLPQTRNLLCISLILHGLWFLSLNKPKIYILFNLVAITIHKVGIIYLLFYFLQKISLRKYIYIVFIGMILAVIGLDILPSIGRKIFFANKVEEYLAKSNKGIVVYLFYLVQVILDLIIIVMLNRGNKFLKKDIIFIKFILFLLPFSGVMFLNTELFIRLYRNIFVVKFFILSNLLFRRKKITSKLKYWFIILVLHVSFFITNFRAEKYEFFINLIQQIEIIGIK